MTVQINTPGELSDKLFSKSAQKLDMKKFLRMTLAMFTMGHEMSATISEYNHLEMQSKQGREMNQ